MYIHVNLGVRWKAVGERVNFCCFCDKQLGDRILRHLEKIHPQAAAYIFANISPFPSYVASLLFPFIL